MPAGSVRAAADSSITHTVTNHNVFDEHDVQNALKKGPHVPATVSYEVRWSGANFADVIKNTANRYEISFVEGTATVSWTGETADAKFVADPGAKVGFAAVGRERNGKFFT